MKYPALILCCLMASAPALADPCKASRVIEQVFPADGLESLQINALAGDLRVSGVDGNEIRFHGRICTDKEMWLDRIGLDAVEGDGRLALTVVIPYREDDFKAKYASMDVEVEIPTGLPTSIKDSSGQVRVSNASVIDIDDSSGDIGVIDGRTALHVRDSSGDIDVRGLTGDVAIEDSSGNIQLRDIQGSVSIPRDSSGDIDIQRATGAVNIDRDSAGSISIDDTGPVTIGSDGSGSINISKVQGDVNIDRDGSGGIRVADISGDFQVRADGSGDIRTQNVRGKISIPGNRR
ncbi:MAG: hypothetical protein HUJ31_01760 [Pseudomonadales bacterium]|nr:hypothetical protein [Pseudomonadales bacterium]